MTLVFRRRRAAARGFLEPPWTLAISFLICLLMASQRVNASIGYIPRPKQLQGSIPIECFEQNITLNSTLKNYFASRERTLMADPYALISCATIPQHCCAHHQGGKRYVFLKQCEKIHLGQSIEDLFGFTLEIHNERTELAQLHGENSKEQITQKISLQTEHAEFQEWHGNQSESNEAYRKVFDPLRLILPSQEIYYNRINPGGCKYYKVPLWSLQAGRRYGIKESHSALDPVGEFFIDLVSGSFKINSEGFIELSGLPKHEKQPNNLVFTELETQSEHIGNGAAKKKAMEILIKVLHKALDSLLTNSWRTSSQGYLIKEGVDPLESIFILPDVNKDSKNILQPVSNCGISLQGYCTHPEVDTKDGVTQFLSVHKLKQQAALLDKQKRFPPHTEGDAYRLQSDQHSRPLSENFNINGISNVAARNTSRNTDDTKQSLGTAPGHEEPCLQSSSPQRNPKMHNQKVNSANELLRSGYQVLQVCAPKLGDSFHRSLTEKTVLFNIKLSEYFLGLPDVFYAVFFSVIFAFFAAWIVVYLVVDCLVFEHLRLYFESSSSIT